MYLLTNGWSLNHTSLAMIPEQCAMSWGYWVLTPFPGLAYTSLHNQLLATKAQQHVAVLMKVASVQYSALLKLSALIIPDASFTCKARNPMYIACSASTALRW